MAISTYAELQGAVADWINREGQPRIADWITLAEAGFNPQIERQTTLAAPFRLSNAAPTNTLLTLFPNLYLHATLAEAQGFLIDPEAQLMAERGLAKAWDGVRAIYGRGRAVGVLTLDPTLRPPTSPDPLYG